MVAGSERPFGSYRRESRTSPYFNAVMVLAGYGIPTNIRVLLAMFPLMFTPFRSPPGRSGRAGMRLKLI